MNGSLNDFSPMLVDQQIDDPDALLSQDNALFVHEVRAMFEQEKNASIEQGWTRLASQRESTVQQSDVLDISAYRQRNARISPMSEGEMSPPPLQTAPKKRLPRLFGLIAAVLVCITLVGSLSFVLAALKGPNANTRLGIHGTTPIAQKSTPTPAATPTLTIPAACKDDGDLADETLCAQGKETIINITRSFTANTYNPNGSANGSGTINVTFHRAYADTSRLMLVYTINRAPHTDWGDFVTLSTKQGMIGAGGGCLFKGFCVQSFDTRDLPAHTTQIQVQTINVASGLSIPLAFTLPLHTARKTITVKQTVSSKEYTITLDHLVLTGSTTVFDVTYKIPPTKEVMGLPHMQLQAITINGQKQATTYGGTSSYSGDNNTGGMSGYMNVYQSFLDQPGSWIVTLALVNVKPGPTSSSPVTFSPVFTGTFTFTVSA